MSKTTGTQSLKQFIIQSRELIKAAKINNTSDFIVDKFELLKGPPPTQERPVETVKQEISPVKISNLRADTAVVSDEIITPLRESTRK